MRVLLLAGTSEARTLALALSGVPSFRVTASLAGTTRAPLNLGVDTRFGGFGGIDGLEKFITDQKCEAVIDATHPFAAQMSLHARAATKNLAVPYLMVQRPPWQAGENDRWFDISDFKMAADLIAPGNTVFLGTGRQTLEAFANMQGRRLLMRVIDAPDAPFPYPDGAFLQGRPPFSVAEEIALFRKEKIDWLVVKNSGGQSSRAKLDAAAELGLPVAMLVRPKIPKAPMVETVDEALLWLRDQLAKRP